MTDDELARFLCRRTWKFGRADGSTILLTLRLLPGGRFSEHTHPNETSWRVKAGRLEFLDLTANITTRFETSVIGQDGAMELRGEYRGYPKGQVIHTLIEKESPNNNALLGGPRVAVLIRTHVVNAKLWDLLDSLSGSPIFDLYVLADETHGPLAVSGAAVVSHTVRMCSELGLYTDFDNVLWKCGDYPIYCALSQLPDYDYYIQIEFDVQIVRKSPLYVERLIGRLRAHPDEQLDLVIPYLQLAGPQWMWASAAAKAYTSVYMGFFPFVVLSARAANYLLGERRKEALRILSGSDIIHCEAFCGTALLAAGHYKCIGLDALIPGSISTDTFSVQGQINFLLGAHVVRHPEVEMLHPVLDAKEFLSRALRRANIDGRVEAFIACLDEMDPELVPFPLREEFRWLARSARSSG